MTIPKRFLRPRQFHQRIGGEPGLREIYSRLRAGEIRAIRVGKSGRWLIPASEVEDWPRRATEGGK